MAGNRNLGMQPHQRQNRTHHAASLYSTQSESVGYIQKKGNEPQDKALENSYRPVNNELIWQTVDEPRQNSKIRYIIRTIWGAG